MLTPILILNEKKYFFYGPEDLEEGRTPTPA